MPRGRPRKYVGPLQPGKTSAAVPKAMTTTHKPKANPKNYRLTAPMRMLVDKRVNKHLETKELRYMLWQPTDGAGSTAYTLRNAISELSIKPLICPITQSDDPLGNSPYRLGNVIHPVSMEVRVKLYLKADEDPQGGGAADRGAIQPYLFVGYNKNVKSVDALVEDDFGATRDNFWRRTDGISIQEAPKDAGNAGTYDGDRYTFVNGRLNTDLLRPVKGGVKQPVMIRPVGFYQNPVASEGGGGFATSHEERNYVIKIPVPKKLKYSNNTSEFPENFAPFLACGFTYVGGAAASIQAPLRIETSIRFKFKDA